VPLLTQPDLLDNLTEPQLLPALRLMQILQAFGMMIIPAAAYLILTMSRHELRSLFVTPERQPVMLSIVFFMVAFPLVNFLAHWNETWQLPGFLGEWSLTKDDQAGKLTTMLLDMPNGWMLALNLLMIGLLPAIGEELIFRGILQRGILKWSGNPHAAIWLAAIVFSAVHFQILGFVPRLLMGVAMGYLFFWSGNLWYPMIAHLTNNSMAVLLNYGIQHGQIEPSLNDSGIGNAQMAAFSFAFCLMLLFLFKQMLSARNVKA
jgi:membrane protease YdiL (CAAX protease family)